MAIYLVSLLPPSVPKFHIELSVLRFVILHYDNPIFFLINKLSSLNSSTTITKSSIFLYFCILKNKMGSTSSYLYLFYLLFVFTLMHNKHVLMFLSTNNVDCTVVLNMNVLTLNLDRSLRFFLKTSLFTPLPKLFKTILVIRTESTEVKEQPFRKLFISTWACAPSFGEQVVGYPIVSRFCNQIRCPLLWLVALCDVIICWALIGRWESVPECWMLIGWWVNEDKNHACHVDVLYVVFL